MLRASRAPLVTVLAALLAATLVEDHVQLSAQQPPPRNDEFRFRSGVDLVNITASVVDRNGRFVSGLQKEDFLVYEDGMPQTITHFSSERVPVSLGIALDTSGSMAGEKIEAAENALDGFLFDLLDPTDEVFLYRFSDQPEPVQGWTADRQALRHALGEVSARGGTALYDTAAEAVTLAQTGKNRKKALVLISDGNDTASRTSVTQVKQLIRDSEVLVYAVGIDSSEQPGIRTGDNAPPRLPIPLPWPFPPGRRPVPPRPTPPNFPRNSEGDHVNEVALRELTDDSGGRTEIVKHARDLDPATSSIADELSKQYYIGYPAAARKDGRWHSIRVEVRQPDLRVRARRGYTATP